MRLWLRQVALVARDLASTLDEFRRELGLEVGHVDPGVSSFGLENSLLPVGTQFLEVVAPVQDGTTAGRYLERRKGDGGYMVICQCDDHAPRKKRVNDLGIRKVLEFDQPPYHCMQLHPKDTGGSFLEIDFREGADPVGPWEPAGHDWQKAVRTDVVDAITAVDIQSPDPDKVANRWSEIVERPVENASIALDNATIRFVRDEDGRGEGLSAVDLRTSRPEREITICGVRFRLSKGRND